jgi:hypothetical protein
MDVRVGNIFEVAELMEDVIFGLGVLGFCIGLFYAGYLGISWFISKVCGN